MNAGFTSEPPHFHWRWQTCFLKFRSTFFLFVVLSCSCLFLLLLAAAIAPRDAGKREYPIVGGPWQTEISR